MNKGIQNIFSEVSSTYELINHVLTCGLDYVWRKKAAKTGAAGGGSMWLDVCSGTGDMAVNLSRLAPENTRVFAADFSLPMIREAVPKPEAKNIVFVISEVKELPFADETFDLITISFATRNLNTSPDMLIRSFREFQRVLKPGGRFVNLETSQPSSTLIRKLFHAYIKLAVKPAGQFISGSKAGYIYLSQTIPRFYNAEDLAGIIRQAGFSKVEYSRLMMGAAAIHVAVK